MLLRRILIHNHWRRGPRSSFLKKKNSKKGAKMESKKGLEMESKKGAKMG
jgi:hypothetical protein